MNNRHRDIPMALRDLGAPRVHGALVEESGSVCSGAAVVGDKTARPPFHSHKTLTSVKPSVFI